VFFWAVDKRETGTARRRRCDPRLGIPPGSGTTAARIAGWVDKFRASLSKNAWRFG